MAELVLGELDTYVTCLQNTATQFIITRPIKDHCLSLEHHPNNYNVFFCL